jgi:hypothetical protein
MSGIKLITVRTSLADLTFAEQAELWETLDRNLSIKPAFYLDNNRDLFLVMQGPEAEINTCYLNILNKYYGLDYSDISAAISEDNGYELCLETPRVFA